MSRPSNQYNLYPPVALLLISAFWAPIAGGYVTTDGQSLSTSTNLFLAALAGDPAVPYLSHALVALPALIALIWVLLERKIQQVPSSKVSIPLTLLMGLVIGTAPLSQSRSVTIPAVAEWLIYGVAFFATVAIAGRRKGPLSVLVAIFVGCLVVSLAGIREYGEMRPYDPTWRIFGHWIGPNALAAMLLVGLILGMSITLTTERIQALLAGLGTGLIGFALALTQSKGGMAALGIGLFAFVVTLLFWGGKEGFRSLARVAAVGALIGVLAVGLQFSQRTASKPGAVAASALSRFANAEQTQEQSFGFRKLLWQGSAKLIQENPAGYGAGTYRYWSAKPGLTTITQFAHNSYLQLGVESSALAIVALLGTLLMWTWRLCRNPRGVPLEQRILRAGVFGAVTAVAAHCIVDSDLHYFGIGFVFFVLLAVGLLLCADAVAPEFVPPAIRYSAVFTAGVLACALFWAGWIEGGRSQVRGAIQERNFEEGIVKLQSLSRVASDDGEVWYLTGVLAENASDRLAALERSVSLQPWPRNLRALARAQIADNQLDKALQSYERALNYDPNNLPALLAIMKLYEAKGDRTSATNAAERLVSVESTPYFQVRSQPDLVPTETAQARAFLADQTSGLKKIELLEGALKTYREYAQRTLPQIASFAKSGMDYAGQGPKEGRENLEAGKQAALSLAEAYRAAGRSAEATAAEKDAKAFAEAIDSLR